MATRFTRNPYSRGSPATLNPVGVPIVGATKLSDWKFAYPAGAECVCEADMITLRSVKPRFETWFATSTSSPPGVKPRSVVTSASLRLPSRRTIARAKTRVCWPRPTASERTYPIVGKPVGGVTSERPTPASSVAALAFAHMMQRATTAAPRTRTGRTLTAASVWRPHLREDANDHQSRLHRAAHPRPRGSGRLLRRDAGAAALGVPSRPAPRGI